MISQLKYKHLTVLLLLLNWHCECNLKSTHTKVIFFLNINLIFLICHVTELKIGGTTTTTSHLVPHVQLQHGKLPKQNHKYEPAPEWISKCS